MAIEARTRLDQIEITGAGIVQVRLAKEVTNGDVILSSSYHRTAFGRDTDVGEQLAAVNAHLLELGYPEIDGQDVDRIKAHVALVRASQ